MPQQADARGTWIADDGHPASVEATTISVRPSGTERGAAGHPCVDAGSPRIDVDLVALRSVDQRLASASAAGRLVELALFDTKDAGTMDPSRMYRDLEYLTARYAAFPNVVWCLHGTSANDSPRAFWRTARRLVMTGSRARAMAIGR